MPGPRTILDSGLIIGDGGTERNCRKASRTWWRVSKAGLKNQHKKGMTMMSRRSGSSSRYISSRIGTARLLGRDLRAGEFNIRRIGNSSGYISLRTTFDLVLRANASFTTALPLTRTLRLSSKSKIRTYWEAKPILRFHFFSRFPRWYPVWMISRTQLVASLEQEVIVTSPNHFVRFEFGTDAVLVCRHEVQ